MYGFVPLLEALQGVESKVAWTTALEDLYDLFAEAVLRLVVSGLGWLPLPPLCCPGYMQGGKLSLLYSAKYKQDNLNSFFTLGRQ